MRTVRPASALASLMLMSISLLLAGCYDEPVYAPAPPPPPTAQRPSNYGREVPPLVRLAQRNGYRAGFDDGGRDAYYHAGYDPRRDEKFEDAPGYDYQLGPIPPYVDAFRESYLRGYEAGFHRR